jgi:hypothetical protein
VACGQTPHSLACAQERADDVGRENPLQPRGIHRIDPHLSFENAGVVDERRQGPELVRGLEQTQHVRLIRHVGLRRDGSRSSRLDRPDDFVRGIAVLPVIHADRVSSGTREPRRRCAYATAAARDHDDPIHSGIAHES